MVQTGTIPTTTELWFSTDNNPANKVLLGSIIDYVNEDDWSNRPGQLSGSISLVAGQSYYIEVLHKEATGGDHVSVGWTGPGISTRVVIPGANLAGLLDVLSSSCAANHSLFNRPHTNKSSRPILHY
jgi:hypothetical protein